MVRVSARARTTQEANQLGGAVILPLIFLAVGQATGLLLVAAAGRDRHRRGRVGRSRSGSCVRGAQRFTRDQLAAQTVTLGELSERGTTNCTTAAPKIRTSSTASAIVVPVLIASGLRVS